MSKDSNHFWFIPVFALLFLYALAPGQVLEGVIQDVNGDLNGADGHFQWEVIPNPGEHVGAVVISTAVEFSIYDLMDVIKPADWTIQLSKNRKQIIFARGEHGDYLPLNRPSFFGFFVDVVRLGQLGGTGYGYLTLLNDFQPGRQGKTLDWAVVHVPGPDMAGVRPQPAYKNQSRDRYWQAKAAFHVGFFLHARTLDFGLEKSLFTSDYADLLLSAGSAINLFSRTPATNAEPRNLWDTWYPLFVKFFIRQSAETSMPFLFSFAATGAGVRLAGKTRATYGLCMRTEIKPFGSWRKGMSVYLKYDLLHNPFKNNIDIPLGNELDGRFIELFSMGLRYQF